MAYPLFEAIPVRRPAPESSLVADFSDFEEAVIQKAACHICAQAIMKRNRQKFGRSGMSVHNPAESAGIFSDPGNGKTVSTAVSIETLSRFLPPRLERMIRIQFYVPYFLLREKEYW
jgi:hypothetical protein